MPFPRRLLFCLVLTTVLAGAWATAMAAPPQQGSQKAPAVAEPAVAEPAVAEMKDPLQRSEREQASRWQVVPDNSRARNDTTRSGKSRNEDGLSDSIRRIERSTRGQVLSAERVPYQGRNLNRIKVVDDRGRVRVYMDDPHPKPKPVSGGAPEQGLPTRGNDD